MWDTPRAPKSPAAAATKSTRAEGVRCMGAPDVRAGASVGEGSRGIMRRRCRASAERAPACSSAA
eukprot:4524817-Amphidinium_carterae.1